MERNELNEAIGKAAGAVGIIEQLEDTVRDLKDYSKEIPGIYKKELEVILGRLETLIRILDDNENLSELYVGTALGKIPNKIDRLRLGGEIIRLRELGKLTNKDIAQQLGIDVVSVSRFCKFYDKAKPSIRSKYQRTSIFDTTQQYEDISVMIYRQLARLENVDSENHVRYISELRQLIKAAQEWMNSMQRLSKVEELRNAIAEILISELPERRLEILKVLNNLGIKGSILPTNR